MIHELTGQTEQHLTLLPNSSFLLHRDIVNDFIKLQTAAAQAGFQLEIVSSFRSYARQLTIWNEKTQGKRSLLSTEGKILDFNSLPEEDLVHAILRWSALPGASRHHWGTDLDIYDEKNRPTDYEVQLTPAEVADEGFFGPLHLWLDEQIAKNKSFGFFRPYAEDLGGVAPERWHLSYAPVAQFYFERYTLAVFTDMLESSSLRLKEFILDNKILLYERYLKTVSLPSF